MPSLSAVFKTYNRVRKILNTGADTDDMKDQQSGLPKGLKKNQLFDGFYVTPGTGDFDPRDCSNPRNATSPWCGYNPVSTIPFNPGLSVKKTKCGVLVKFAPTIGYIEFPPGYAAYINPECRDAYEAKYEGNKTIQPPEKEGEPYVPPPVRPANAINDFIQDECYYIVELGSSSKYDQLSGHTPTDNITYFEIPVNGVTFKGWHTGKLPILKGLYGNEVQFNGLVVIKEPYYYNRSTPFVTCYGDDRLPDGNGGCSLQEFSHPRHLYRGWQNQWYAACKSVMFTGSYLNKYGTGAQRAWDYYIRNYVESAFIPYLQVEYLQNKGFLMGQLDYRYSLVTEQCAPYQNHFMFGATGSSIKAYLDEINGKSEYTEYFVRNYFEVNCETSKKYYNPSDDCHPKHSEDCCDSQNANCYQEGDMGCCEDKNKDLLALLRKIDKKLGEFPKNVSVWDDDPNTRDRQKKSKSLTDIAMSIEHLNQQLQNTLQLIGIEEFPIGYPESVVVPQAQNNLEKIWNWLNPKKERKIKNIAQLIDWGTDQSSAVLGQWQQYVEYPGKPDKKGNPTKEKVVLPDIATTLRELFKMLATNIQMNGLSTDIQAKSLATSTNNSIMILEALETIKDMQLYMDYVSSQKSKSLPIQISPGEKATDLKKYLQPSTVQVTYDQWQPENDDSLQEGIDSIRQTLVTVLAQLGGETK